MYYVYSGYLSSDHCDCQEDGPLYQIDEFETEKEVLEFKEEFFEEEIGDDCSDVKFRVFKGEEIAL